MAGHGSGSASRAPILAIMGSGETAPPMARVHRDLVSRLPAPVSGVVLDTPYGFQENADEISARAVDYFRRNVGVAMELASLRAEVSLGERAGAMARIRAADIVFCGPGSPSYALRLWRQTELPGLLAAKLRSGGLLTFASAAALTLGTRSIPVYEIYKVGEEPRWLPGLDLLGPLGMSVAVVPHFDNAEGGTHDTRFCYMGERRLSRLERELRDDEWILGVDSHTALVLDLDAETAEVEGLGAVTVRVAGRSEVLPAGSAVPLHELSVMAERLRRSAPAAGAAGARATRAAPTAGAAGPAGPGIRASSHAEPEVMDARPTAQADAAAGRPSPLLEAVAALEARFEEAEASLDRETALRAVLELDELLLDWSSDTDGSGDVERARSSFVGLVTRLAAVSVGADRGARLPPDVIELLIDLRGAAREAGDWATADRIREALKRHDVAVQDLADGTVWHGPAD